MANLERRVPASTGEAVLITGCSSGIGWASAVHLAQHGFTVFASVRKPQDAERLRALDAPNLIPICPLDLTRLEHIPAVVEQIRRELTQRGKSDLYALINNAGGGGVAPVELIEADKFQLELQARLVGPLALLQALLPMIRQAHGRIVWIATPAIIPTPYVATIHACDFAVNCLARTLNIELQPWGIPNIMVRCGGIQTPAGLRTTADAEAILQRASVDRAALYAQALRRWAADMAAFDQKRSPAEAVARVILRALTDQSPQRQYSVGHMASMAALLEALPQGLTDWILKKRFASHRHN